MVNNDQYNGYHRWPKEWEESQPLEMNEAQAIQQELPTTYYPHPAFEDAEHMTQFAYAAYVRSRDNQRRVSQSQPDADARAPTPLERPTDSRYPHLPPSYEEGWLALKQRRQNLQQQYQPHYQQPQQQLQYQSQYQSQNQTYYSRQQQEQQSRLPERRRQQEEQREQEREKSRQQERQRLQEEHQKQYQQQQQLEQERQKEQKQREWEIQQQQQQQEERRRLKKERKKQERQKEEQQQLQQELDRRRREEQQRQQITLNAQRRQYERHLGTISSSPTYPTGAAQSGPRFSQDPPSKSRRLNNGAKVKVKQTPPGSVARTFKAGDYVRNSPSQSHAPLKRDMIQPMNNADELKKFSYDPTTIAHDVLINCAKHPTERPLNEHMQALRKKFPEVDASKDLTTFRWDLVEEAQASLASQIRETGAALPVSALVYTPAPAPARSAQPVALPPPTPIGAPVPVTRPPVAGPPAPAMLPAPAPTTATLRPSTLPANAAALPWVDLRVPRSPNPHSNLRATPTATETSKSQPARAETPRSHPSNSYPEPQVIVPPSPAKMSTIKKRGRPKRVVEVAIPAPEPTIQYPVFRCRWDDCRAEMHNLQALESHVMQMHIPYSLTCNWDGCRDQNPRAAAADNSMVVAYARSHGNQTTELSARAMTDGGIRWLDDAGVTAEASSHRISPVMCQETVNQEEMVLAN
ncbi:hypothetical protein N7533_006340 [Penicillium manginii]|uniref:uncharacterized protein n=1 Tax=Penicillium manginii TaxID=203109 RepID=UPI00254816F5|nr:uncharacterized protein N7533_006340 [Penicillium manginii]KAJ5756797.1 hypothetical protein N7533_006340 [Penicillium manginii]